MERRVGQLWWMPDEARPLLGAARQENFYLLLEKWKSDSPTPKFKLWTVLYAGKTVEWEENEMMGDVLIAFAEEQ